MRLEILNTAVLIIFRSDGGISTKVQNSDPKVPIAAAVAMAEMCPPTVLLPVSVSVETISVSHFGLLWRSVHQIGIELVPSCLEFQGASDGGSLMSGKIRCGYKSAVL